MLKVRNRLLITVVLFAVAMIATVHGRAEARGLRDVTSARLVRPIVGPNSGEPDSGDAGRSGNLIRNDGGGGIIVRLPNGYLLYLRVSRLPLLGAGW